MTKDASKKAIGIVVGVLGLALVVAAFVFGRGFFSKILSGASKDQVFTKAGITITLPGNFDEQEIMSQTAVYVSKDCVVTALKEEFSIFEQAGIPTDISLGEYANLVITNNMMECEAFDHNGLTCFTYEKQVSGKDTTYLASVYKASDAYWLVQFACASDEFAAYEEDFYQWADSVQFA